MEAIANPAEVPGVSQANPAAPPLKDLLEDGIYLLFFLRSGNGPAKVDEFNGRVDGFLAQFERHASNFGKPSSLVTDSKYAFCALLDELVLSSNSAIREEWERSPLQLRIFGDHLAGDGFFQRLEALRLDPTRNIEALEVFHACLLLGFQGRYLLEGSDKRKLLITRIGQEIAQVRKGVREFAPHWKPAFRFQEFVRHDLPIWIFYLLLALVALLIFLGFSMVLRSQVKGLDSASGGHPTMVDLQPAPRA